MPICISVTNDDDVSLGASHMLHSTHTPPLNSHITIDRHSFILSLPTSSSTTTTTMEWKCLTKDDVGCIVSRCGPDESDDWSQVIRLPHMTCRLVSFSDSPLRIEIEYGSLDLETMEFKPDVMSHTVKTNISYADGWINLTHCDPVTRRKVCNQLAQLHDRMMEIPRPRGTMFAIGGGWISLNPDGYHDTLLPEDDDSDDNDDDLTSAQLASDAAADILARVDREAVQQLVPRKLTTSDVGCMVSRCYPSDAGDNWSFVVVTTTVGLRLVSISESPFKVELEYGRVDPLTRSFISYGRTNAVLTDAITYADGWVNLTHCEPRTRVEFCAKMHKLHDACMSSRRRYDTALREINRATEVTAIQLLGARLPSDLSQPVWPTRPNDSAPSPSAGIPYPAAEVELSAPEGTDACKICFERASTTVCVPCGHVYSCVTCILIAQPRICAICREGLASVIRFYGRT